MSWVDNLITGRQSFESVIGKNISLFTPALTQVDDQVRIKLVSQLIKDCLRVFQNIFKYFNGAAISAFIISQLLVSVMILALNSNEL